MIYVDPNDPWLNRKEAADFMNTKPGVMAVWDCTKRYDFKPFKFGGRTYYLKSNLIRVLEEEMKPR